MARCFIVRDVETTQQTKIRAEVTGWDADNESISWDGYGDTEDEAVQDAIRRGGIIEVGDARIIGTVVWSVA